MSNAIRVGLDHLCLDTDSAVDDGKKSGDLKTIVEKLIERGRVLHEEVEIYVESVVERQKLIKVQTPVEYRNLRNDVKNELSFLRKIANSPSMDEEKARQYIVSSNLVYYEAVWSAAKRSSGLQSFRKHFFWDRHNAPAGKHACKGMSLTKENQTKGKLAALVDIVAGEGMEWIRVSTISPKRLLFDLAKLGWMNDSDSDEEMTDAKPKNWEDEDDDDQVCVVKSARELARAARANPVCGRPPRVQFVLTRITQGESQPIDTIIAKIRATGIAVQCANDIPPPVTLSSVLPKLLLDRSRALSDILNIDCTILLALISDISHRTCPILEWYPGEVRAQIEEEAEEHLLSTHLYPAIGSHAMICTKEAAEQMNVIVQTLATDTERTRADLLLGKNEFEQRESEYLVERWKSTSDYQTPEDFRLPVSIITVDIESTIESLPAVASKIASELGPLNNSIFLHGWAKGLTTLSANRARARQIDTIINEHGLKDGEAGPHIWLCGDSRSLIARHGRRR